MVSDAEVFLEKLTELFGKENAIHKVEPLTEGGKPIFVFFYEDLPEKGTLTAITYGLSESHHPDWQHGRPELIVSLDSQDKSWGLAAGYFASEYQGKKPFCYGDLYTLDSPISDESKMVGYFIFSPSFLSQEQATIKLPGKTVHLAGMYPIYEEEIEIYKSIGLERFWKSDGFDLYDVHRKNIGLYEE